MNETKSKFIINILVKVLYLFIFLSILFYYIIQPQITAGLRSMTTDTIPKNIFQKDNVFTNQLTNKDEIQKIEELIPIQKYSTDIYNNSLKSVNIIIIIFITLIILSIYLTKRKEIPILKILGFNLLLFSIIGTIEYLFFMKVAAKYVPIKTSDIIETFKNIFLN
jgi:uncharacterized membrane protein YesL